MQSLGKIAQCAPAVGAKMWFFLPAGLPRSGKLPVLFLLTGQKSGFLPRRGDSLHRFRSNFGGPTGTWVRLAVQNFMSCRKNYALDRKMNHTLFDGLDELYRHAKFGEHRTML